MAILGSLEAMSGPSWGHVRGFADQDVLGDATSASMSGHNGIEVPFDSPASPEFGTDGRHWWPC